MFQEASDYLFELLLIHFDFENLLDANFII